MIRQFGLVLSFICLPGLVCAQSRNINSLLSISSSFDGIVTPPALRMNLRQQNDVPIRPPQDVIEVPPIMPPVSKGNSVKLIINSSLIGGTFIGGVTGGIFGYFEYASRRHNAILNKVFDSKVVRRAALGSGFFRLGIGASLGFIVGGVTGACTIMKEFFNKQ